MLVLLPAALTPALENLRCEQGRVLVVVLAGDPETEGECDCVAEIEQKKS